MQRNYLFRSRRSSVKYLGFAIFLQVTSTLLFVALAVRFTATGSSKSEAAALAFLGVSLYALLTSYIVHADDLRLLHSRIWPLDNAQDFFREFNRLLDKAQRQLDDLADLEKSAEGLFLDNHQLLQRAKAVRATRTANEAADAAKRILDLRKGIRETIADVQSTRDNVRRSIESLAGSEDFKLERRRLVALSGRAMSKQASIKNLRQDNESIARQQLAATRQLAG